MDTINIIRCSNLLTSEDNTLESINFLINELSNAKILLERQYKDIKLYQDTLFSVKQENETLKDENKKLVDKVKELEEKIKTGRNDKNKKVIDTIMEEESTLEGEFGELKRCVSVASIMNTKIAPEIPSISYHNFETITNLISESCDVCKKSITFVKTKLRCSGCLITVHEKCKSELNNSPCFMRRKKDAKENESKSERHRISYFCPEVTEDFTGYCVPHIIQNCIHYLNENCLINSADLYNKLKITAQERNTSKDLLKSFHQRRLPDLSRYSPKCIAFTVLLFLSELSETLIPPSSYKEFINYISREDLHNAIIELPLPNKHTLVMLLLHWKKYIKRSLSPIGSRDQLTNDLWQILLSSGRNSFSNGIINEESVGKKVIKSLLTDLSSESLIKILKENDQKTFNPILRIQTKEKKPPRLSLVRKPNILMRNSERLDSPYTKDKKSTSKKSPWR
uniref:Phorbol-ester/DAG-type domain-containing protein n=1 Tax=Parastrongyloides trichosuri TaxID=131310 RepID=A0A0N4ZXK4_PARTI